MRFVLLATYRDHVGEVYRRLDGRMSIERLTDRYVVYDETAGTPVEVWSCRTLGELYDWLISQRLSIGDFVEVS